VSSPPRDTRHRWRSRRRALALDTSRRGGLRLRASGFWDGVGGLLLTALIGGLVVALLVGWVLAWANTAAGANALWLTLGSVAFAAVLIALAVLMMNLRASHRLRHTEAAFLTGASHNLRTPLTAIRTAAQTLRTARTLGDEDRALLLDAVLHETTRLELRIDNLLETARLDLEPRPFAESTVDLRELLAAVLADARWAFAAQQGEYVVEPGDPVPVLGDRRALRLLLENLVDNALKYAEGPPHVTAQALRSADHAVARIKDRGLGFPSGSGDALFTRFHRGDTGRPGNGLGLALARAIARGHGGDVRLASDGPGRGALAELWLPIAPDLPAPERSHDPWPASSSSKTTAPSA